MATIRTRKVRTLRRRDGLVSFARNNTSQGGEDGIIAKIFEVLDSAPDFQQQQRWCVDVGAWDGKHLSNTYSLLVEHPERWNGVLIEAEPDRVDDLKALHDPLGNVCIGACVSCTEGADTSLSLLLKAHAPRLPEDFSFISIDVDGTDYWVLLDILQSSYSPAVICVEFNPTIPDSIIYVQERQDNVRHGSSLAALCELADQYHYVLVETTVYNAFFVKQEIYENTSIGEMVPDTSIEALHEVTMGTELYQLYDGTLKLHGCKKLLWHRQPIDEDRIQMLSRVERGFPFAPEGHETSALLGEPKVTNKTKARTSTAQREAIDLSVMRVHVEKQSSDHPISEQRVDAVRELWSKFATDGFAYVRGTGVSADTCRRALAAGHSFFTAPDEVRSSCLAKDRARRGYSPEKTENFASLVGNDAPNDEVRKFRIGKALSGEGAAASHGLGQDNVWPGDREWGSAKAAAFFKQSMETYYNELERVGQLILATLGEGMEQCADVPLANLRALDHANQGDDTASILTLLGYGTGKKRGRNKKTKKNKRASNCRPLVAEHTDVGIITVLLFDRGNCARLERAGTGGSADNWVPVSLPEYVPDDPVFVVNIGDCLSEISGGALKSTVHRVAAGPGPHARVCLAMFMGFSPSTQLEISSGDGSSTQPMTYAEWRQKRIAASLKVLRESRTQPR